MRAILLALAIATLVLAACAGPHYLPPPNIGDPSFAPQPPSQGYARVYVFRPEILDSVRQNPLVLVDGKPSFVLDLSSYKDLELPAGRHVISVVPGPHDNVKWGGKIMVELVAGGTYFFAIWEDTKYVQSYDVFLVPGRLPLPIPLPVQGRATVMADGVRFEQANEADALVFLKERRPAGPVDLR
jgi:hypothetical protein